MIVESYEDVIVLSGSLSSNNWETIHTAITLQLKRHPSGVVLDCSGLTQATPEGALTFHDALDYVKSHEDARIMLAAVPPPVEALLKQTPELRSQLPIVASVEEARRSLDVLDKLIEPGKDRRLDKKEVQVRVLCVVRGNEGDVDVMVMTRELVNNIAAKVLILIPIVVPRDLPLTAPIPDLEEKGAASASRIRDTLSDCKTPHEVRMERTRDLAGLLHETSEEIKASYVVLSIPPEAEGEEKCMKTMQAVLAKVKRPVLFVRGHAECLEEV